MRTWSVSPRAALIVLILAGIGIPGGCARRARTQPPPVIDVTAGAKEKPDETGGGIRLPGQNRVLPSEDPRNRPQPGAPADQQAEMPAEAAAGSSSTSGAAIERSNTPGAAPDRSNAPGAAPERSMTPGAAPDRSNTGPARALDPAGDLRPPAVPAGETRYRVQLFASSRSHTAFAMRDEIASNVGDPVYIEQENGLWKVRVGDCRTREDANALRRRMIGLGYADAFVHEAKGE